MMLLLLQKWRLHKFCTLLMMGKKQKSIPIEFSERIKWEKKKCRTFAVKETIQIGS